MQKQACVLWDPAGGVCVKDDRKRSAERPFKLIFGSGAELLISDDAPQLGLWEGLVSDILLYKPALFAKTFSDMSVPAVSCGSLTRQSQIKLFFSLVEVCFSPRNEGFMKSPTDS